MKHRILEQHFHDLLAPIFPDDAEFVAAGPTDADHDEIKFRVTWPTPTPERTKMRSRPLVLHLTSSLLEDYAAIPDEVLKADAGQRITQHLRGKLAAFNPDRNAPAHIVVELPRFRGQVDVLVV